MTREQRVKDLIQLWQPRLGLEDWTVRYNPKRKPDRGNAADSTLQRYMRFAEIGIDDDCPDSELESCVLHELLHVLFDPLEHMALNLAGSIGNKKSSQILLNEVHDDCERIIETVTFALTGHRQKVWGRGVKNLQAFAS